MELFLVGSEMFFKSIKIPVSLSWKAHRSVSQQCGITALISHCLADLGQRQLLSLGASSSPMLNLGSEPTNPVASWLQHSVVLYYEIWKEREGNAAREF